MIFSSTPFSSVPFSSVVDDYSVLSLFSGLISNQDADRAYLFDCQPYDPTGASTVDVGFSDGLKRPILNGRAWPARVGTVLNMEVNLFSDSWAGSSGRGSNAFGVMTVKIGDGDHDAILDYLWDGRQVRVLMGADGFDYSEFEPVFVGTAADIEFDERELRIIMRDKAELLNLPIQETVYSGSGGLEGGDDIKGQGKPLCYGVRKNITPILVDRANLIYQWHDGSSEACDGAFDGALALTPAATPDVADITVPSVAAGEYVTQLSGGYIKLGAEPAKALTLDVRGDNTGGYVDTAADIGKRVVINHTMYTASDIDLQSISDTNTANSAAVGWYGNSGTPADVLSQLMDSIGGSWVFNRSGELVFGVFQFSTSVGTISRNDIKSIQRVRSPIPTWRRQLGYAESCTVQSQQDLVSAATDARKDFVSRQFRLAVSESAAIKTRRALSESVEINTLLDDATEAATEAARQQGIFGADRHRYNITAKRQQFKYRAGQTITIDHPRFGFPADAVILGIVENTGSRNTEFRVLV